MCIGFRLTKTSDYFRGVFDHFLSELIFLGAAGAVLKFGMILKPNKHDQFLHDQIRELMLNSILKINNSQKNVIV